MDIVRILMSHGADPYLKMTGEHSALDVAMLSENIEMVNLLDGWLGVYNPDERIMQQLVLMIKTDREDQVKAIVDEGVDLNAQFEMVT